MLDQYVLALDQGTTSSRAILFGRDGLIAASAQREFPQIYPKAGWVEHDPEAIWETQLWAMREVMALAGASAGQVAAIGITNQRETTVVWDRATGRPIHNAIVWQCRRTAPLCDALKEEGFGAVIAERTGLVVDAYFSGTKVAWLLENIPGARDRARRGELAFGTIDAFLLWRLSGGRLHATDVSNASRTMLYNIHTGHWDEEILQRLGVPHSMLPDVLPSSTVYGVTDVDVLGGPIRLAGVAGDQQAATFGQTCFQPRMVKNTYGTGCFLLLNTGHSPVQSQNGLLTTVGWQIGSDPVSYALEGSVFVAGAAVQWLRDGLGLIKSSGEVEDLARAVSDSDGVFVVPAFVGLGAPHWDPYARGTIVGLTRGSGAGHIARATLESIAFQVRDVVEAMVSDSGMALSSLRADGGAAQNALLMQYQADLLGVPVEVPSIIETTALGAAYLAGLAVGFWSSMDELAHKWSLGKRYEPTVSAERRDSWYAGWRRAVDRSRDWAV